jgi:hypothetical protein
MAVLLTRRAVLQAAVETTYDTPAAVGANDGFLVSKPTFTVKPNVLERDFVRNDLSPMSHIIGRKLASMEFETELRGNGKQQSGNAADAALIARLFRACGYAQTANAAAVAKGPYSVGLAQVNVAWAADASAATNTDAIAYFVTVSTGGASGVAQVTVTSDTVGEGSAAQAITTATALTLGTKGLTLTPTWTGNLVVGQQWVIWLLPAGISLDPISDNFESLTLVMHKDGVKHVMPGAFGTFEITAQAGSFATAKWTFTGTYSAPVDDANPHPVFETQLPSQVELARLRVNAFNAVVEKFTFNQQNDIQIRPDVSSSDGYIGTRIVSRKPEGGIAPEADLVANNDFWGQFASAEQMPFQMRVGHTPGNTIWVLAPSTQYTGMTYTDRNGILAYDAGLRFARVLGNDEICFYMA